MDGIDGKQHSPNENTTGEGETENEKVPQKEVTVKTTLLDNEGVRLGQENKDPSDGVFGQRYWFLFFVDKIEGRFWCIDSLELQSKHKEAANKDSTKNQVGHQ